LHWWNARNVPFTIPLSKRTAKVEFEKIEDSIDKVACLLVRYGTDQYVGRLASDQEKYEGRLKNKVLPASIRIDEAGLVILTLRLPVHKRIGTQFRCFIDVSEVGNLEDVKEFLESCEGIKNVDISRGIRPKRILFLLDENPFGIVETIDKITNNMIFPE
jgi:hypothetical protein